MLARILLTLALPCAGLCGVLGEHMPARPSKALFHAVAASGVLALGHVLRSVAMATLTVVRPQVKLLMLGRISQHVYSSPFALAGCTADHSAAAAGLCHREPSVFAGRQGQHDCVLCVYVEDHDGLRVCVCVYMFFVVRVVCVCVYFACDLLLHD